VIRQNPKESMVAGKQVVLVPQASSEKPFAPVQNVHIPQTIKFEDDEDFK
jgi:hypothetical protein